MSALEPEAVGITALGPAQHAVAEESTRGSRTSSIKPRARQRGLPSWARLVSPLLLLVAWQLSHVFNLISESKLPPPTLVATTAWSLIAHPTPAYGSLQGAMLVSLERFALGFAFGGSAAVLLALGAGLSRVGEAAIDPLAQMIRTLPLFGLIPVFIVLIGIGDLPKILLVALAAAVPLYLNTYSGIRSVDGRLFELGHVLGLSRWELLRNVVFPGALPQALVGLRQSMGAAWLSLVVAEQVNAHSGLGFMINQAEQFLQQDVIFVALAVYTLLGLVTDWIVRVIERRTLAYRTDLVIR